MRRVPLAVTVLLVSATLAGCLGGTSEEVTIPTPSLEAPDANNTTLGPLGVPTWQVGQWWGHHTYFGADDTSGSHFNVVVTEASASGYRVASMSTAHAMIDAQEDLFDLGAFGTDLSTTRGGEPWTWYEWPLEENKTWSQSLRIEGTVYELVMTATYEAELRTGQGEMEGFRIIGSLADGTPVIVYDYIEALGWFSDVDLFDPNDPGTAIFKIRNMGFGEGRTGDYHEVEIVDVVNATYQADSVPLLTDGFIVPEGTVRLMGEVRLQVDVGHAMLFLEDANGATYEYTTTPPGSVETAEFSLQDPPAGEWDLTFIGLGVDALASLQLTAVVQTTGTL